MNSHRRWLVLAGLLVAFLSHAQVEVTVTRGPYLQLGTQTNMIVRWRTDLPSDSVVRFGSSPTNLNAGATNLLPVTEHEVRLENLQPGTIYYYAIGTSTETLSGDETHFFKTAPASPKPTRIWVIGDSGSAAAGGGNSRGVRDAYYNFTKSRYTDVWLMLGDNAYYNGEDTEYQRGMFDIYQKVLRQTPPWSTIGNHETYSQESPDLPYFRIFTLPEQAEAGGVPSGTENYYSFNYGNIHFVCLDSEISDRSTNGQMAQWLEADLAANTNQWLIAFWHSPPYSKGSHNSDSMWDSDGRLWQMRERFVPILERYGVDLVLSGHSHCYERSYLLNGHYGFSPTIDRSNWIDKSTGRRYENGPYYKRGSEPDEGAIYIVAGSSGWTGGGRLDHPAMCVSWMKMGSLVLDIDGNELDATFIEDTGVISDRFAITKGVDPEPMWLSKLWLTNGVPVLRWRSEPGKTYVVEQAENSVAPTWLRVGEPIYAASLYTTWTNNAPATNAFFRIKEIAP